MSLALWLRKLPLKRKPRGPGSPRREGAAGDDCDTRGLSSLPVGISGRQLAAVLLHSTSAVCGLALVFLAGDHLAGQALAGAILACSALAALTATRRTVSFTATVVPENVASSATPAEDEPPVMLVAETASIPPDVTTKLDLPSTTQDLQTALRLFGSAIIDQVETSVSTVLTENNQMREVATEMASAAGQAKDQFDAAMHRANETETGIEQLNNFNGELTGSINVIANAVKSSIAIVREVSVQASETRACVETMASLANSVNEVIELIETIARQSRMLSLNASIEAARAGEAGKGFRVVATEVDQLARGTSQATRTISTKIEEMSVMVGKSVASLQGLVIAIDHVDVAASAIVKAITEQESVVERVTSSLTGLGGGVYALSRDIREAAQIAANCGMLSDLVLETATLVDSQMTGLKGRLLSIGDGMDPLAASEGAAEPARASA